MGKGARAGWFHRWNLACVCRMHGQNASCFLAAGQVGAGELLCQVLCHPSLPRVSKNPETAESVPNGEAGSVNLAGDHMAGVASSFIAS